MPRLASRPLTRVGSWAILTVSVTNLGQVALWHHWPVAVKATSLMAVLAATNFLGPVSASWVELVMTASAALAVFGTLFRLGWGRILIFVPQHLFLGLMGFGGLVAAYQGHYLDGTIVAWPHILADQIAYLALFAIHSSAILRRCRDLHG